MLCCNLDKCLVGNRRGQALDLKDEYLSSPAKNGKENAEPQAKANKADGNWPEVEIRVASKHAGVRSTSDVLCIKGNMRCSPFQHDVHAIVRFAVS